jgi:hypothetical protein
MFTNPRALAKASDLFCLYHNSLVSDNVVVSAKPRDLSPTPFWAGPLADLVSQGCAAQPSRQRWEDVQAPRIACNPQCRYGVR